MTDLFNSANDPVFFMHHGGMDYLWAMWQEQDPKRIYEYDRPKGGFLNFSPLNGESELWMGVFAPTIQAKLVADTLNRDGTGILCVKYEGLPFESYMS
jgi:tyrosinase